MMQLFMWKFQEDTEVKVFCMTQLVMGNKPSSTLSVMPMAETARLRNKEKDLPIVFQALTRDCYVDNVFRCDRTHLVLQGSIKEIEQ